ncbi:Lysosome-associated membrane glycoprotein 1 [Branchiostoma belcheri]|nr:Lysosome-associated membrane glycoprotein 1 [Branchiostoma belcheri]
MSLIPTLLVLLCVASVRATVGYAVDDPSPPVGHFVVNKKPLIGKAEPCLLLDISAMFHVGYIKAHNNTLGMVSFPLPTTSVVSGDCSHLTDETHSHLNLKFNLNNGTEGTFGLNLTFERNLIFTHFSLSEATMKYTLVPDLFPDAKNANATVSGKAKMSGKQFFYTHSNAFDPHSYLCDKTQTMDFDIPSLDAPKSTLSIHHVQVQPFYVPSSGKFSGPETCPEDITTTPGPNVTTPQPTPTPLPVVPVGHFALNDSKGNPCVLLNVGVMFRVEYDDVKENITRNATYVLPQDSTVGGGCDESKATIALSFSKGFNLTATFKTTGNKSFELVSASVGYVRTPELFPNASMPGRAVKEVEQDASLFETDLGKSYLCKSLQYFDVGSTVKLEVVDLQVQPFAVKGRNFSEVSECAQDLPFTTTMMPIHNATTVPPVNTTTATMSPIGNATTVLAPNTTAATLLPIGNVTIMTTPMKTPKPTGPPKEPPQGHFEVKDTKGHVCLLANMSLQFSVSYTKADKKKHIGLFDLPKTAHATGFCSSDNSSLTLTFHDGLFSVTFGFVTDKKVTGDSASRFNMSSIEVMYTELPSMFPGTSSPDARKHVSNTTLNIFSASTDKSYMCKSEVNITVSKDVTIMASQVQLQPFGVKSGKFSSAEECSQDTTGSNTVPVIIGVIVGVIVVVVFVAYIVVKRSKARPQKFTIVN